MVSVTSVAEFSGAEAICFQSSAHYGNTYGLLSFQAGGTKLIRSLPEIQRKFFDFEIWCSGELSKIGHHFSNKVTQKLMSRIKNVHKKEYSPKLVFFNEKKTLRMFQTIFEIGN